MFSNKPQTNPSNRPRLCTPLALALSATLAFGGVPAAGFSGQAAWAEDIDINVQADAAQQEVERTAAEYDQAMDRIDQLNQQIADNEQRISEIEETLPEQQERSSAAAVKLYKAQASTPGLLEMVLSSENIVDFFTSFEYVSHIFSSNQSEIERLQEMKDELDQTRRSLSQAKKDADTEAANAEQALAAAQEARQEAQRKAQEEAARQAEEAAKAAEAQAAAEQAAQTEEAGKADDAVTDSASNSQESAGTGESSSGTVEAPSDDGADWTSDRDAFVAQWAGRINAYLAGSPMAGTGETFAEAAWDYGVDPRWSPAISNTESSKGLYCFNSCNAWGWGSASWDNWDDAIRAHVAGLARGYGYTISVEAAKKYCPPNWEHWYSATLAQMNMI